MMFEMFNRHRGPEPKPPPDLAKVLVQALQLVVLGAGFLIYLDEQNSAVIWISFIACIACGVLGGVVVDRVRSGKDKT